MIVSCEPDVEGVNPKIPLSSTERSTAMPPLIATSEASLVEPTPQGDSSSTTAPRPTPIDLGRTTNTSRTRCSSLLERISKHSELMHLRVNLDETTVVMELLPKDPLVEDICVELPIKNVARHLASLLDSSPRASPARASSIILAPARVLPPNALAPRGLTHPYNPDLEEAARIQDAKMETLLEQRFRPHIDKEAGISVDGVPTTPVDMPFVIPLSHTSAP
ncbi:hypothetical protein HAX54_049672 [Datura stramonium]|uniref:Uncharacterized protein n=1 Tax=Datura stramonium TaxID=4076 RepID=A0ABS8WPI3_DATST|nr:hypothetical protein [Datura stramonium]